ncbi:MAG: filamentous hemagglutinin N-terminal domain-containing protein [Rhodocyclaceae bacterium]|nr:filamentous hemagglutinin N-terminal domain-containing protein [Rhodocyclaceae bacterium]MDZ4215665.1 filamentous hemagglutinin N-terminal domain-containing protein [Rhodocyclaceae bacterium]
MNANHHRLILSKQSAIQHKGRGRSVSRPCGKAVACLAKVLALSVYAVFSAPTFALPTDPAVVNGTATFNQVGNVLTVTNSAGAIINWQTFNIGAGETTHFLQASSSSAVLNQVLSNNPSAIYGTLSSNGIVWLINQAGILIGPGAIIDTAGFVASTLKVRPEDFLAGQLNFQATVGAGDVVNQGEIRTPSGGFAYLIGSNVSNEGIITTPNGETILAAGNTVSLIDTGTPGVKVAITGDANNATNLGQIVAEAGRIGIAGTIVKNSGTLDASSVVSEGGRIFLKASQDTYVDGNGHILATGTKGGQVEVLGNRVAVMDNAEIDASGRSAGGTILVGGDYQGNNPDVQNAWITYFGPDATLKANATDYGDGGKVIVWADDITRAYGRIEAKGGNGGFVETSGKRYLDVNGIRVDTAGGTWLLDPTDITVVSSGTAVNLTNSGGIFSGTAAAATIGWDTINGALSSGNVIIHTSSGSGGTNNGTITFSGSGVSAGGTHSLSFLAENDIAVNADITFTSSGNLTMVAGWNSASGYTNPTATHASNTGNLNINANITLNNSGVLKLLAKGNLYQDSGKIISGNTLDAKATGWIDLRGNNLVNNVSLNSGATQGVTTADPAIYYKTDNTMTHLVLLEAGNGAIKVETTGSASNRDIGIKTINAGGDVSITAQNVIADDNGSSVNIKAPNINLRSTQGIHSSSSWGVNISSDVYLTTMGTLLAEAAINSGTGGIRLDNHGTAAGTMTLSDNGSVNKDIEFRQYGDLTISTGDTITITNVSSKLHFGATGNLIYNGGVPTGLSELTLVAGGNITINQNLTATHIGLAAGMSAGVEKGLDGTFEQAIEKIRLGYYTPAIGSKLDINAVVTGTAGAGLTAVGLAGYDININSGGSVISNTSNIVGFASNNITLTGGSSDGYIQAGGDIKLRMTGSSSTLYLNKLSGSAKNAYLFSDHSAGTQGAIYLDFAGRSSGGVVIDGVETTTSVANGSGLFVGNRSTPALPGAGLNLTYGVTNTSTIATITNETNNSTQTSTTLTETAPLTTTSTDFQSPSTQTTGGDLGEFGSTSTSSTTDDTSSATESSNTDSQDSSDDKPKKKLAQCK